ncbi:LysR substrate-binding domain-containing protein [Achromobacter insuavis]
MSRSRSNCPATSCDPDRRHRRRRRVRRRRARGRAGRAPFQTDQLVLLVSASHPVARRRAIAFEECLDYDFVGLNRGSSLLNTIRAAAQQAGRALRLRVQVRSFDAMAEMIANNLGIGVLPAGACAHRLQPGRLKAVRLTDAWSRRELVLATNPERPLTRAAGLLVDHLLAQAPRAA